MGGLCSRAALLVVVQVVLALGPPLAPPSFAPRYVVVFRDQHEAFRAADFYAAAFGRGGEAVHGPAMRRVTLVDDNDACRLAARSVLVRYVVEEYGSGATLEGALCSFDNDDDDKIPASLRRMLCDAESSWRVSTLNLGASRGRSKLRTLQDRGDFAVLGPVTSRLAGPVDLKRPREELAVIRTFEREDDAALTRDAAVGVVFGRVVCEGASGAVLSRYAISRRPYAGTTTMAVDLAFLMARLANVEAGSRVLDPFAGTASVLLATTHFSGTRAVAADLDARVLLAGTSCCRNGTVDLAKHPWLRRVLADTDKREKRRMPHNQGKNSEDRSSIRANFDAADLPSPFLVVSDVASLDAALDEDEAYFDGLPDRPPRTFDAIVTDPPYGIRERVGTDEKRTTIFDALFHLAARRLEPGGRLVFWVPTTAAPGEAPRLATSLRRFPPAFDLVTTCTQKLSTTTARTLVVCERK